MILFDFVKMNLSFKKEGRMIELKGISDEVKLLLMSVDMVSKNHTDKICIFLAQIFLIASHEESVTMRFVLC